MLDLSKLLILTLQLLLVNPVALHFGHGALVVKVGDGAVDLQAEVMVVLEELGLTGGVSVEWPGRGEGGGLEGLHVLVMVTIYHAVHQRVFTVLDLDVFCWLHLATREANVEWDIVCTFVQLVPFRDLRLWSIIFPSKPWVSILPFIGWSSNAISSWWWRLSRRPAHSTYLRLTHKPWASYGYALGLSDWRLVSGFDCVGTPE